MKVVVANSKRKYKQHKIELQMHPVVLIEIFSAIVKGKK